MLTLVVEISQEGDKLKMCAFERSKGIDVTLKHYSECTISNKEIENLCEEITNLFNKAVRNKESGDSFVDELKKNGRALFDYLLTIEVKKAIKDTKANFLLISIDEHLVQIPWELLHDGGEFLCIRFAMGRSVKTRQKVYESKFRDINVPIKMLVVADPTGDLNSAYEEGISIRNELDKRKNKVKVLSKTGEVYLDFIKRNIRDYDIVHFAGHAEYNSVDPSASGWLLKDGKFTAKDIVALGATAPMPSIVFSNACQSGKTQEWLVSKEFQDEIYGLANAFLLAGVRHYIGTFWKVLDKTCLDFANEFYKDVTDGLPIGEAVRLARIKLVHEHGYHSIIWSSYMLYGEPSINLFIQKEKYKQINKLYRLFLIIVALFIIGYSAKIITRKFEPPSIVIFGFDNLSDNLLDWNLSHAISDNLIKLSDLNIVDITTLVNFNELKQKSLREICKPFDIQMIIKGQYKREKDKIKANLKLENPINGRLLGTKEVMANDEIDLVEKMTLGIIDMLKVHISSKDKLKLKIVSTNNLIAYKLFSKTWDLYLSGNNNEAIELCKKALELDPEYLDVYKRLGNIYDAIGDSESALNSYFEYARLSEKKGDLSNLANAYVNIGWIYHNKGDYERAYDFYNKGIMKSIEADDKLSEAKAYRQLASWYSDKKEYEKATGLLLKSIEINRKNINNYNHKYNLACDYQEFGFIFSRKEDYDKAFKYFNKSLNLFKSLGAIKPMAWVQERIKDNVSDSYAFLGDTFFDRKEYDKALRYYLKSLNVDKAIDYKAGLADDYRNIGEVYAEKGQFEEAMNYYNKSIEIGVQIKNELELGSTYEKIGLLFEKKGDYKEALTYLNKALSIYEKVDTSDRDEIKAEIEEINKKLTSP